MKDKQIKIVTKKGDEFNSEIVIGGEKYFVQTEMGGSKTPLIITRVYLKGQVVSVKENEFKNKSGFEEGLQKFMLSQHEQVISVLKEEKKREAKNSAHYFEEVKVLLRKNETKKALKLLDEALAQHPDNLYLISYKGYLEADVHKNFEQGIMTCQKAIKDMKEKLPFGEEFLLPFFYLNLGKAYVAAGRRREAFIAFDKVMEKDPENRELGNILKKIGSRRKPFVRFLRRSHPINKYMGMLLHKFRR
jgi:tetratricopeptide (TPR) repeat protein